MVLTAFTVLIRNMLFRSHGVSSRHVIEVIRYVIEQENTS